MINIIPEPAQIYAGITNGCDGCGCREKDKIKTIEIRSGYGGNYIMINLCDKCRHELAAKLTEGSTSC